MNKVQRFDVIGYKDENGCFVKASDYDAAQSELAALREELAKYRNLNDSLMARNLELTAAEQRNAELVELLRDIRRCNANEVWPVLAEIDAALKPTESGARKNAPMSPAEVAAFNDDHDNRPERED